MYIIVCCIIFDIIFILYNDLFYFYIISKLRFFVGVLSNPKAIVQCIHQKRVVAERLPCKQMPHQREILSRRQDLNTVPFIF